MFDTKTRPLENPWKPAEEPPPPRPRPAPAPQPGPLVGATPAVGGRLFEGMYDGDAPVQPKLVPRPRPGYVDKPVEPGEPEPLTGIADERLQKMKQVGSIPLGKSGAAETSVGQLIGGVGAGVAAGVGKPPSQQSPQVEEPRLTEGEKAEAIRKHKQAAKAKH